MILTQQDSETIAVFGQVTWYINEQFSVTFSGRFAHEEKDGTTEQFPAVLFTKTGRPPGGLVGLGFTHLLTAGIVENNFSPGGNIQWRPNDDTMFYFSGSRGFKGGGFDHQLSARQTSAENGFRFGSDDLNLTTFFRAYYVDDHFLATDLAPNLIQDDYWKIDARIAVSNAADTWELAIVGRDLTDEITAGFGNDGNGSAGNSNFSMIESPRAIALQSTYRF